jgi:hypothetical protein
VVGVLKGRGLSLVDSSALTTHTPCFMPVVSSGKKTLPNFLVVCSCYGFYCFDCCLVVVTLSVCLLDFVWYHSTFAIQKPLVRSRAWFVLIVLVACDFFCVF